MIGGSSSEYWCDSSFFLVSDILLGINMINQRPDQRLQSSVSLFYIFCYWMQCKGLLTMKKKLFERAGSTSIDAIFFDCDGTLSQLEGIDYFTSGSAD